MRRVINWGIVRLNHYFGMRLRRLPSIPFKTDERLEALVEEYYRLQQSLTNPPPDPDQFEEERLRVAEERFKAILHEHGDALAAYLAPYRTVRVREISLAALWTEYRRWRVCHHLLEVAERRQALAA